MQSHRTSRRTLLASLAALPLTVALGRQNVAMAAPNKMVVFSGVAVNFAEGIDIHVFGWAAETAEGWVGRVVDSALGVAMHDLAGNAAGVTKIVPKGMANTINNWRDPDGVRGASVCFEDVTEGSVEGSRFALKGKLTHAENPIIFRTGDPMSLEGDASTGEFTYTLRGDGKDQVIPMKGMILIS